MSLFQRGVRLVVAMACAALLAACERQSYVDPIDWPSAVFDVAAGRNLDAACVQRYDPSVDYFPEKVNFSWSDQLQVDYGKHYKYVTLTPSVNPAESLTYLLVQCGTPVPKHDPGTVVVHVPIRTLVTGDIALLSAVDALGLNDRFSGTLNPRAITIPALRARYEQGLIRELSGVGHASIEGIMAVSPDVYFTFYSAYPNANIHPRLVEMGVRAFAQADHLERHPLGRAEWLKVLGLLSNREDLANRQFDGIVERYQGWADRLGEPGQRPRVMAGSVSGRAIIELFGGQNQLARLIQDAGGEYVYSDNLSAGSWLLAPFEKVYAKAASAPVWINAQAGVGSLSALAGRNARHAWFASFRNQQVYARDRGYEGAWAYPYLDQSLTRPDDVLAETIFAIHADSRARPVGVTHQPRFLRRLPP